jgi:hypothetical protein
MIQYEEILVNIDQILPVGNLAAKTAHVPFLSNLLTLCRAGCGKIWFYKGFVPGRQKIAEVPPLSSRRLRPGVIKKIYAAGPYEV